MAPKTETFAGAVPGRRLGRRPPPPEKVARVLPISRFYDRSAAAPPSSTSYRNKAPKSLSVMLGNDQFGDCTIAAALHGLTAARAVAPGGSDVPASTAEAVQQYESICGPGDNGCYVTEVLDALRDRGLKAGSKTTRAAGYAALNLGDALELKLCIYLFGAVHLGINLPLAWYQSAGKDSVWDVTPTPIVGGHSIQAVDYDADYVYCSTWGVVVRMTWAAYQSSRFVEESYVILHDDWDDASGLDANGFKVDELRTALAAVAAGSDPSIPDPPVPPGPPVPPTPGPLVLNGTLDFFGQSLAINLTGEAGTGMCGCGGSTQQPRTPWGLLVGDIAAIMTAVITRDPLAIASAVAKLLHDLGVTVTRELVDSVRKAILSRFGMTGDGGQMVQK